MQNSLGSAADELAKEVFVVKSNLDIFELISANATALKEGRKFFGHLQQQSHALVVLGLSKIYERPTKHSLASISGVCALLDPESECDPTAHRKLCKEYEVEQSGNWHDDLRKIRRTIGRAFSKDIARLRRVRNLRIAHLVLAPVNLDLPGIARSEMLLRFAIDIHSFIAASFLNTIPHPTATDIQVKASLAKVLGATGIKNVQNKVSDI